MATSIGVDVGGTKILAGLVDDDGRILETIRRDSPRNDPDAALTIIAEVIRELVEGCSEPVAAAGVGIPGPVDEARSRAYFAPNLGWQQVPVRQLLEAQVPIPVVVENDGNAAAWGEFAFGAGIDVNDLTLVTVGTGIGGGIIIGDRLLRGSHGTAGEIGHMNVVPNGRPCGCGRHGCWEQYASGSALVREARALAADRRSEAGLLLSLGDGTPEGVHGAHVTEAALAGDPVAIDAFTVVGTWLGRGLADLAAVLDPAVFVIGGGVSEAGDLLLDSARETLTAKVGGSSNAVPVPAVRTATLGNEAGLIGAADLARRPA